MIKKDQEKFTIIIPSKIFDNNLNNCLKRIRNYYKHIKIIVLLDKKNTNSKFSKTKIVVTGPSTIGYKRNFAAKLTKTKYISFIDSDAYPTHKWLDIVLKNFKKSNRRTIIVGGPNLSPKTNNIEKKLVARSRLLPFVTLNNFIKNKNSKKNYVKYLPACNFTVERYFFLKLGGMHAKKYSAEELPFLKKVNDSNFKILFDPKSYIYHKDRDFKHYFRQRFVYGSNAIYYFMNFPNKETFFLMLSTLPFIYLLFFPFIFTNLLFLFVYLFGTFFLIIFLIASAIKINYGKYFFKSLKLSVISVFTPGYGFILGLFKKSETIRNIYTQE